MRYTPRCGISIYIIPNGDIRTISNMSRGYKRAIVNVPCPYEENQERLVAMVREEMEIAGKEITDDFLKTQLSNQAMKFADRITAVNAQAQDAIGLKVRITRTYDDVGLHGGKDDCEWCLERVGDWDNYKDAYDAGAFERHPGCGCLITYEVGKTRTWSVNKSGWSDL